MSSHFRTHLYIFLRCKKLYRITPWSQPVFYLFQVYCYKDVDKSIFITPLGWAQSRCNPKKYPEFSEPPCFCLGDSRLSPDQSKLILDNACRSFGYKVIKKNELWGSTVGYFIKFCASLTKLWFAGKTRGDLPLCCTRGQFLVYLELTAILDSQLFPTFLRPNIWAKKTWKKELNFL
jgi:hypothetical protein